MKDRILQCSKVMQNEITQSDQEHVNKSKNTSSSTASPPSTWSPSLSPPLSEKRIFLETFLLLLGLLLLLPALALYWEQENGKTSS